MARNHTISRRDLAFGLVGLSAKSEDRIEGGFVHESADLGHRIRDRAQFAGPRETVRVPVVIVGGGISGLSAAWRFVRRRFTDFVLLELESQCGGNARWGENEATAYPWAAHYVPVPGRRSTLVRELFEELGVLRDGHWEERYLCHSPQERLFIHGRWQEGLEPQTNRQQAEQFATLIEQHRTGRRFTIPMEEGWRKATAAERALDQISMKEWLASQGLHAPELLWYIDYACRDDYGTALPGVSAWAGIHYFASREPDDRGPLTWPEGNGWIVRRLLAKLASYVRANRMVYRITRQDRKWRVYTGETVFEADAVIFAAPTFLASWLIDPPPPRYPLDTAPWMTANLTLERWPEESDSEPAWDNVIYGSKSLGYVVATHQSLKTHQPRTVWTWYHAFAEGDARDQRRVLLGGDWRHWKEFILTDLERAHPDIRQCVSRIDIMRLGHAMPRPAPGSMFLNIPTVHRETLHFAHSDLSRLPLFEEAQYRGVTAADRVLAQVGRS